MKAEVPEYAVQDEVAVDPSRTALVAIDMQSDFVKQGGGLLLPDAEAPVPAIRRLLELARASRMHVVYSQDTHRPGDPDDVVPPVDSTSALEPFDLEASFRQIVFVCGGRLTTADGVRVQ